MLVCVISLRLYLSMYILCQNKKICALGIHRVTSKGPLPIDVPNSAEDIGGVLNSTVGPR